MKFINPIDAYNALHRLLGETGCKTQTELANKMGVTPSAISTSVNAGHIPEAWRVRCRRFEKPVDWDYVMTSIRNKKIGESEKIGEAMVSQNFGPSIEIPARVICEAKSQNRFLETGDGLTITTPRKKKDNCIKEDLVFLLDQINSLISPDSEGTVNKQTIHLIAMQLERIINEK